MQNHMRNVMQFKKREMKGCQVMAIFVLRCSQKHGKDRNLKDFHFSSTCEEGESPCTLL